MYLNLSMFSDLQFSICLKKKQITYTLVKHEEWEKPVKLYHCLCFRKKYAPILI